MELAVSEMDTHQGALFVGIFRDISNRKEIDRLKREFVSTVSHELRTPLTAVQGALGLISGGAARVLVIDYGSGILESFTDRIFQKFSQAVSSNERTQGGTGLGLSISRAIIEQHNGSIGFDADRNDGATFYFDLPVL